MVHRSWTERGMKLTIDLLRRLNRHPAALLVAFAAQLGLVVGCGDSSPVDEADGRGDVSIVADSTNRLDAGADALDEDPLTPLIDHALWVQTADGDGGVFADHRPELIECGEAGLYQEDGLLEINTSDCNYLEVVQPSLIAVNPGDTIEASLWYGPLVAEGIAEAHAAIVIDGEVLWERQIPIPNPGGLAVATITPTRTYPAGVPVLFHLHNHGLNTWTLVYIGKY